MIALGSNRRHHRHGGPRAVLAAARLALAEAGITVAGFSPVVASRPLGPSDRTYANAVAAVVAPFDPPEMLARLKEIESRFGRRPRGRRWASRVLDLDVVLWDGGCWADEALIVPHRSFRERIFVLGPALRGVGGWHDPLTGLSLRQLHARLTRPRPAPKPPHT
nr:2-amino-4-hydroxy-6-hydroxymethyldihydropteridine diphosphokinase [Novosphingobium flavum]